MSSADAKTLHVCFTMDVERIKSLSPPGGTPTWEFGELCVRTYCDALRRRGYPATLFIVPDTAIKQPRLFQQMRADGHECGLHIHPQGWGDNYKNPDVHDYLGGYSGAQQFEMLQRAKDQWAHAVGFAPETFRAGNFSGNDDTFRVLDALQFRSSSTSQPGRIAPQLKAVWAGALRSVHRAHRSNRLIEGDLTLVEVPGTVDATRTDHWTGVGDARLEDWEAPDILHAIEDSLKWQFANKARTHHLCLFTHSYVPFGDGDVEVEKPFGKSRLAVLHAVLDAIPAVAARFGLVAEGSTLSTVRERYLDPVPQRGA